MKQPLCTAVRIVQVVDKWQSLDMEVAAVVGHSTSEIGAANAAGVLWAADDICIPYYSGLYLRLACGRGNKEGFMLVVGGSAENAFELVDLDVFRGLASISAYNSSKSLTFSEYEWAIVYILVVLENEN